METSHQSKAPGDLNTLRLCYRLGRLIEVGSDIDPTIAEFYKGIGERPKIMRGGDRLAYSDSMKEVLEFARDYAKADQAISTQ
jgi:hypothetical protein